MTQALADIKVLDFSWIVTGPLATCVLAQHGATVVKVESITRPCMTRPYSPYKDNIPGVNRGSLFLVANKNKLSMALNIQNPRSLDIARSLVAWADVVVESFTPGMMKEMGLGYKDVCDINRDVIMVSASMLGQTGPHAGQSGLGTMLQSMGGLSHACGWADRPPCSPYGAYTDSIAPFYLVASILAALDYRRQTGNGQYIDLSQLEAGLSFLSPALLDYAVNSRIQGRAGNRSSTAAPRGIYRCRGKDRWCAIEVSSDEQWKNFCRICEGPWTKESRFSTLLARLDNADELERLIETWTINFAPEDVMRRLQEKGVPAGVVASGRDLSEDPQLAHQKFYEVLNHPEMGETRYEHLSFTLSRTPAEMRPDPCLGQDTEFVCTRLLGMTDDEFTELLNAGVFE